MPTWLSATLMVLIALALAAGPLWSIITGGGGPKEETAPDAPEPSEDDWKAAA